MLFVGDGIDSGQVLGQFRLGCVAMVGIDAEIEVFLLIPDGFVGLDSEGEGLGGSILEAGGFDITQAVENLLLSDTCETDEK